MSLADWQRFTKDPEDTDAPIRCAARSRGRGRIHDPSECRECAETMGVCLRRLDHGGYWHEGRSSQGNLVSWPTEADPAIPDLAPEDDRG